jgi:hypothetical protein
MVLTAGVNGGVVWSGSLTGTYSLKVNGEAGDGSLQRVPSRLGGRLERELEHGESCEGGKLLRLASWIALHLRHEPRTAPESPGVHCIIPSTFRSSSSGSCAHSSSSSGSVPVEEEAMGGGCCPENPGCFEVTCEYQGG